MTSEQMATAATVISQPLEHTQPLSAGGSPATDSSYHSCLDQQISIQTLQHISAWQPLCVMLGDTVDLCKK